MRKIKGGDFMAKILSDAAKYEIAKELGVANIVQQEGWGGVPSRQCGNIVKKAMEIAERTLAKNQ